MDCCRNCNKPFNHLLRHLKGGCKAAYTEEEILQMKTSQRKLTHKKAYAKTYNKEQRHKRYVSSKNLNLKPKSPNVKQTNKYSNKEFSCSICEKNCPTKDSLERHSIRQPLCKTKIKLNSLVPLEKKVLTRWCNVMSLTTSQYFLATTSPNILSQHYSQMLSQHHSQYLLSQH